MKSQYKNLFLIALALFVIIPDMVFAHAGHGETNSFSMGLSHPIFGLDHLLAMIAVGLWAAQMGGRATWVVPSAFIITMIIGGAFGISGITIPFADNAILISVIALGFFVAAAVKAPVFISTIVVGIFALFHGNAHGAEMPLASSAVSYFIGFILATLALHAIGIAAGLSFKKWNAEKSVRLAGASIAFSGICLLVL